MTIVFAKPRHPYTSYTDLYTLIDLSGFASCYIDEIDADSDSTYVITILNSEIRDGGYPNARARIHLLDLEYHMDGIPPLANVTVHAADKWYAEQIGARYTPIGSHPDLAIDPGESRYAADFDVAYIGYFDGVPRRQVIRQQLIERGVKVSPTGAWGTARAALLRQSKAFLHVHQHAHIPTIAPLRMVLAAAYKLPVLSERCADLGIWKIPPAFDTIVTFQYEQIPQFLPSHYLQDWNANWMRETGERLHQLLCHDLTFRKSVEAAV